MKTSTSEHPAQGLDTGVTNSVYMLMGKPLQQPLNITAVSDAAVGYIYFCCIHKHNPRTQSYVLKNSFKPNENILLT